MSMPSASTSLSFSQPKGVVVEQLQAELAAFERVLVEEQDLVTAAEHMRGIAATLRFFGDAPLPDLCVDLGVWLAQQHPPLPAAQGQFLVEVAVALPHLAERLLVQDSTTDGPQSLALWLLLSDALCLGISGKPPKGMLSVPQPPQPPALTDAQLQRYPSDQLSPFATKLFDAYRTAMAHLRQTCGDRNQWALAARVVNKAIEVSAGAPCSVALELAGCLIQAVLAHRLAARPGLVSALTGLKGWFQVLSEQGAQGFNLSVDQSTWVSWLHYLADAAAKDPQAAAMAQRLQLDVPAPIGSGHGGDAERQVLNLVRTELTELKAHLESGDPAAAHRLVTGVARLRSTLVLLARNDLSTLFEDIQARASTVENALNDVELAGLLLQAEAALGTDGSSAPQGQEVLDGARRQVIAQLRDDVEGLRETLQNALLGGTWDHHQPQAQVQLAEVAKVCEVLGWDALGTLVSQWAAHPIAATTQEAEVRALAERLASLALFLQQAVNASELNQQQWITELLASLQVEPEAATVPMVEATRAGPCVDAEILDVFLEEAAEVQAELDTHWTRMVAGEMDAVREVRRAFHTLKGSGRMVMAERIGEVAYAAENLLNRILDGGLPWRPVHGEALTSVRAALPALLSDFAQGTQTADFDDAASIDLLTALAQGSESSVAPPPAESLGAVATQSAPDHPDDEVDPIAEVFREEASAHASVIQQWGVQGYPNSGAADVDRALHTLKGSAGTAGHQDIALLSALLEEACRNHGANLTQGTAPEELVVGIGLLTDNLNRLASGGTPDTSALEAFLSGSPGWIGSSASGQGRTLWAEAADQLISLIEHWEQSDQRPEDGVFQQALAGWSAQAGGDPAREAIANRLGAWWSAQAADQPVDPSVLAAIRETLLGSVEAVLVGVPVSQVSDRWPEPVGFVGAPASTELSTVPAAEAAPVATVEDHPDPELLEIFRQEAEELLEEIDAALTAWRGTPDHSDPARELARLLHTFKGSARAAGAMRLGSLAHAWETELLRSPEATPVTWLAFYDQLVVAVEALAEDGRVAEPVDESSSAEKVVQDEREPEPAGPSARQNQEMVRVRADHLGHLLNLSGESSIARARIEQQLGDCSEALEEMDMTILRLRDQLRRLDFEAEAQMYLRSERSEGRHGEFDALEMDRYTQLQQLSRSLLESASDLKDLREHLRVRLQQTETLLVHQSRLNTELQEGLTRTHMVPFARMVPRLHRIVRQLGSELGKLADLDVAGDGIEIDRTVLERLQSPLEHLLRNALDHGLESVDERAAAGKPEYGQVRIRLRREAGDLLVEIRDDGRGIDADRVRARAIERGLVDPSGILSDVEACRLLFHPGFSTATEVTEISGRGVGLDVVASELQSLGGVVDLTSTPGQGTRFELRIPFTVTVNRALMVRAGNELFAVPLNTIEGIVRVSPFELAHHRSHPDTPFQYASRDYHLRSLSKVLDGRDRPLPEAGGRPLPVLLVRGGDQPIAVQVDGVEGSQEIVVRSLGAQFKQVQGLSGATVLGDGSVVVILDLPALLRGGSRIATLRREDAEWIDAEHALTCMVVDDSVTMRKVTSRLLERNGYQVMLARDGVEALDQLHERVPDIVLLDVEMPRMDGFELASRIRHQPEWRHIPMVMITSRTGQKHRDRARELGVSAYLGKPFDEEELLETVNQLLVSIETDGAHETGSF